jgi:para-aminobenzoate synthetase
MPEAGGRPLLVAIDGRSGAGKTSLALELATLLREHRKVSVFHLEDIYPGWNGLEAGIERYVHTVLAPLRQGLSAEWTRWDWTNHYDGDQHTTAPADVVLLEGVGAAHASARPFLDAVIWVQAPEEARRSRALARDGDTYAPFWEQWAAQEAALLRADDPAPVADVLVDKDALTPNDAAGQARQVRFVLQGLASLPALEQELTPERVHAPLLQVHRTVVEVYPDQEELFGLLYGNARNSVWLDSSDAATAGAGHRNGRSVMADDGGGFGCLARHVGGRTEVSAGGVTTRSKGPFFRWLDSAWASGGAQVRNDGTDTFGLGWLGYLGYGLKRETGGAETGNAGTREAVNGHADLAEAAAPADALLLFAGRAVVLDHVARRVELVALSAGAPDPSPLRGPVASEADDWLRRTAEQLKQLSDGQPGPQPAAFQQEAPVFSIRDDHASYLAKIHQAQREISEGNSYEVCLTTQLTADLATRPDPFALYRTLRRRNPAPFAAFLRFGDTSVCSTSPERLMSIQDDGSLRAEPIKGTRPRHADPERDAALRQELQESAKDRAENVMIVDLLRNDLSHFAVPGTVHVARLCEVESYATVHQMVSTIEARLRPEASRAEAVAVAFPAGSMTGAPKISTMTILDRLEQEPREIYAGAIGYFSPNGAADLSVVIRTLVVQSTPDGGRLRLGVGGAITADSVPEEEWREIQAKAFGVLSALGAVFPD